MRASLYWLGSSARLPPSGAATGNLAIGVALGSRLRCCDQCGESQAVCAARCLMGPRGETRHLRHASLPRVDKNPRNKYKKRALSRRRARARGRSARGQPEERWRRCAAAAFGTKPETSGAVGAVAVADATQRSVAAAQAVRHPAHLPCATSGGYQGLSTGGRRSKPQTPRAGRRRFGGLAALRLTRQASVSRGAEARGSGGPRRSARPLSFRRRRTISTTGDPGARISNPRDCAALAIRNVQRRQSPQREPRTRNPLPLRERVANIEAKRRCEPGEGARERRGVNSFSIESDTPHPPRSLRSLGTLSRKGRGYGARGVNKTAGTSEIADALLSDATRNGLR